MVGQNLADRVGPTTPAPLHSRFPVPKDFQRITQGVIIEAGHQDQSGFTMLWGRLNIFNQVLSLSDSYNLARLWRPGQHPFNHSMTSWLRLKRVIQSQQEHNGFAPPRNADPLERTGP